MRDAAALNGWNSGRSSGAWLLLLQLRPFENSIFRSTNFKYINLRSGRGECIPVTYFQSSPLYWSPYYATGQKFLRKKICCPFRSLAAFDAVISQKLQKVNWKNCYFSMKIIPCCDVISDTILHSISFAWKRRPRAKRMAPAECQFPRLIENDLKLPSAPKN